MPEDLDADSMMRPASSRDTKFFWDGVNAHELRIQKRPDGSLQHPPVPAIWQDKEAAIEYQVASGKGTVFSFVVHHAPKVPGRTLPFVIALVELEEGVRMLGELRNVDPAKVEIGMPVRATYIDFPEGDSGPAWTLYAWEPGRMSATSAPTSRWAPSFPSCRCTATRRSSSRRRSPRATTRTSTTIATRRRRRGRKDIFVNILTDTGLVQRYVTDWAGPNAVIKSIISAARCAVVRLRHRDLQG